MSAALERARALVAAARACGLSSLVSSASSGPDGSLSRTSPAAPASGLMPWCKGWDSLGMKRYRSLSRPKTSERRTAARGSSWSRGEYPTPSASRSGTSNNGSPHQELAHGDGEHGAAWSGGHARAERAGRSEPGRGDEAVAHNSRLRGALQAGAGAGSGDLPAYGYDAHGRSGAWPWPPGPGDLAGWEEYLAQGGPQPSLLRGPDGLPCGMARKDWEARLKAYGNAVVPVCAEVAGWVIRDLDGF